MSVRWPTEPTAESQALGALLSGDSAWTRSLARRAVRHESDSRAGLLRPVTIVLDAEGRAVDAIPGVLAPAVFRRRVLEAVRFARRTAASSNDDARVLIADWHAARHEELSDETVGALARAMDRPVEEMRSLLPADQIDGDDLVFDTGSFAGVAVLPGGCVAYGPDVERRIARGSEGLGIELDDATWHRLATALDGFHDPRLDAVAVRNQHARARIVQRLLAYGALPSEPEALADAVGRLR